MPSASSPARSAHQIPSPGLRRGAALVALTAVALGVFALGVGFTESPVAILVGMAALLLAIGSGWVALTRRGPARTRAAWLCVALLATSLIATVGAHSEGWVIILGALSIAASLPLGRYALGRDRASLERVRPPGRTVAPARHPVLLVNPRAGGGKAEQVDLMARARSRGIACRTFGSGVDVVGLARQVVAEGADVVGVAGGDGSQALVADVVSRAGVQMVCVPTGTRNHFAMDLGLDRADPLAALDAFGKARLQTLDVARVNGRAFVNNVSMGVYGAAVQSAQYRERKWETTIEELPDLVDNPPDLRFTGPDGRSHSTASVLHVSNNPYLLELRGAGGRPSLRTGELGIITVELTGAAAVTELLARAALGSVASAPGLRAWTTTTFEVTSDTPIAAGVDGEAVELQSPVRFEIEPGALQVRLPLSAAGRSPAAFVPQLREVVAELFRRAILSRRRWRPLQTR